MPKRRRPRVDDGDVHGDDCNDSSDQLKDGLTFRDRVCVELRDLQVRSFVCLFVCLFFLRLLFHIYTNGYLLVAQWLTNCSTQTLQRFLTALRDGKLGELIRKKKRDSLPKNVTAGNKKCQRMVFFISICLLVYLLTFC